MNEWFLVTTLSKYFISSANILVRWMNRLRFELFYDKIIVKCKVLAMDVNTVWLVQTYIKSFKLYMIVLLHIFFHFYNRSMFQIVKYHMELLNFYANVFLKYQTLIEYTFAICVGWLLLPISDRIRLNAKVARIKHKFLR